MPIAKEWTKEYYTYTHLKTDKLHIWATVQRFSRQADITLWNLRAGTGFNPVFRKKIHGQDSFEAAKRAAERKLKAYLKGTC